MKKIITLALADAKNILRDSTLILILFGPIALFLMMRLVVPIADRLLAERLAFELTPYYPFIVIYLSLIPSMLFGLLLGFLILDERDEEIIAYIAVTPLRKTGYLAYKLSVSVGMSFLFFFATLYLTQLTTIRFHYAVGLALLTALEAPIASLFLAAFAENKVEGLALSKVLGMMYLGPFAAYFVSSHWKYLAGILPPFWIAEVFFAARSGSAGYWLYLGIGFFVHFAAIGLLLHRFTQSQR